MSDEVRIEAAPRADFGKGAARRARRDGHVPAVLYGHGMDPVHLNLHRHQLTMALRQGGLNTLLTINVGGKDQLALAKDVQAHALQRVIQHVDLLLVKKGEKVIVEVPIELVGIAVPGGQINHDLTAVSIEAEATNIPEYIEVQLDKVEIGGQVLAGDLSLPGGATLLTDPEALIVAVSEVVEADVETEAEEGAEPAAGAAPAAEAAAAEEGTE
jgi:large subunit ribosomal protein L25